MDLPSELYYIISTLVEDIPTFINLSLCSKNAAYGCKEYLQ